MMSPGPARTPAGKAPSAADIFVTTVSQGLVSMERLVAIMEEETEALTRLNPQRLDEVVQRKLAQLRELEKSVTLRERLQKSLGLKPGLAGGTAFVDKPTTPQALRTQWQSYCELAQRLEQRNNLNGQLARQGAQSTRQALGMLTGRPQDDGLYQAGKRRRGGLRGYSLGTV